MTADKVSPKTFPDTIREVLERFRARAEEELGAQLVSLVLYGGLARGEYEEGSSDVNLMVVLDDVRVETLERLAGLVEEARRGVALVPLVVTRHELARSTDVFPIKFLDMQRHHLVLCGEDVLDALEIDRRHLRWRGEQEIRNLLMRLRLFFLHRRRRPEQIERTLTRAISSFLTDLRTLLFLTTGEAPAERTATIDLAASALGLDGRVLHDVLELKAGRLRPDQEELWRLYDGFMTAVATAAERIDRLAEE